MSKTKKAAKSVVTADRKVSRHATTHRSDPIVKGAKATAELADQPPLIVLSVATIVIGAALRRPTVARTGVRMLASHLLATGIKTLVKRSVDRTRPAKAIDSGAHQFKRGKSQEHDQSSFPSGHTAGAVAIAAAVAREVPGAALPAYGTAAAVAAAQVPSGKHYLIDTIAGAVIGYIGARLASLVLDAGLAALSESATKNPGRAEPVEALPSQTSVEEGQPFDKLRADG